MRLAEAGVEELLKVVDTLISFRTRTYSGLLTRNHIRQCVQLGG